MSAPAVPPSSSLASLSPGLIALNNAPALMAQAGSVFAICFVTVVLRFYVRAMILRSVGADDWTMLLAFTLAFVTFICYVLEVPQGLGKHIAVVQSNQPALRQLLKIREIHMCCVTIGLSVVKISVSLLFLRLTARKAYRVFLWGIITFMVGFTTVCVGTIIFQCFPVQAGWDMRLRPPPIGNGNAKCFSQSVFARFALSNSIINIATDFLLALLPVPLIWKLQIGLRTKILVVGILSLGLFACTAGIAKSTYNKTILTDPRRFVHDGYSMWNFIELNVGIIAASLPTLKPFLTRLVEVARGLTSGQKESGYSDRAAVSPPRNHRPDSWHKPRLWKDSISISLQAFGQLHSSVAGDRTTWNADATRDSEEGILVLQELGISSDGGIRVTREFTVQRE